MNLSLFAKQFLILAVTMLAAAAWGVVAVHMGIPNPALIIVTLVIGLVGITDFWEVTDDPDQSDD